MASENEERGTRPIGGEGADPAADPDPIVQAPGVAGKPVVGTAIGESDVGAGVRGGDVGRADSAGGAAGGTRESRATVPGESAGGSEDTLDMDVGEFARATAEHGSEAGLAGGQGDLGAGGDLAGDFGGLDEEGDEGTPA